MLSNPTNAQYVSCLEIWGRDNCPKNYAIYELVTFNPQLEISIY